MGAEDWRQPGVEHILQATRSTVRSGSILIFHDGYGAREQTVEAVRILVAELSAQGYELVTVSELLASQAEGENGAAERLGEVKGSGLHSMAAQRPNPFRARWIR